MYIPSYQIHNVLKVYGKQVSQSRILERQKSFDDKPSVDKINLSAEGKRKMIIDKVAAGIVDRITQVGPEAEVGREAVNQLEDEIGESVEFKKNTDFVFNVIDDQNNKKTNTLFIEGSNFLTQRLEQVAEEEGDKKLET